MQLLFQVEWAYADRLIPYIKPFIYLAVYYPKVSFEINLFL